MRNVLMAIMMVFFLQAHWAHAQERESSPQVRAAWLEYSRSHIAYQRWLGRASNAVDDLHSSADPVASVGIARARSEGLPNDALPYRPLARGQGVFLDFHSMDPALFERLSQDLRDRFPHAKLTLLPSTFPHAHALSGVGEPQPPGLLVELAAPPEPDREAFLRALAACRRERAELGWELYRRAARAADAFVRASKAANEPIPGGPPPAPAPTPDEFFDQAAGHG